MSWLFKNWKSHGPEPTALESQKSKQIEQLKVNVPFISEVVRDTHYRVNFIAGGKQYMLDINLPPQFPHEKPKIKLQPTAQHNLVNEQGDISNNAELNNFSVHSDLSKIVKNITNEFILHPPTAWPYSPLPYPVTAPTSLPACSAEASNFNAIYNTPGGGAGVGYLPQHSMPTLPPSGGGSDGVRLTAGQMIYTPAASNIKNQLSEQYKPPEIPSNFPEMNSLSVHELSKLAEDEDQLLQLIQNMPQLQKITEDREKLCAVLEELADANLKKKPVLEDKKRLLLEKYDQMNDLRNNFDEKCRQHEEINAKFSTSNLQLRLKVAAAEAEDEAETVADNFLEGSLPVKDFTKNYMQKRTVAHLRKAKEEKLSQQYPVS